MGNQQGAHTPTAEEIEHRDRSIKRMDGHLQKKLRGGVSYNMKLVVRGERGAGKTQLWRRLQARLSLATA
jgi:Cdc6-like AAA superfamily ATPase